jgi:uncharacterized SAM-binding protein YcdF (DUF218 family)
MRAALRSAAHLLRLVAYGAGTLALLVLLSLVSALCAVLSQFHGTGMPPADCAVVFGAAVTAGDRPGPAMTRRIATAAALYRDGKVKRLFLTGGRGGTGRGDSEAAVMEREAIAQGVSPADLTLEDTSRSTIENLRFTRPLTSGCSSVLGISDGFHLARIRLLASQIGWNALQTYPTEGRPTPALEDRSVAREVLGYIYYVYHLHAFVYVEA